MAITAAPAFAFVHENVPADECSGNDKAGANPTAGSTSLPRTRRRAGPTYHWPTTARRLCQARASKGVDHRPGLYGVPAFFVRGAFPQRKMSDTADVRRPLPR
jgi:hypothetical protein